MATWTWPAPPPSDSVMETHYTSEPLNCYAWGLKLEIVVYLFFYLSVYICVYLLIYLCDYIYISIYLSCQSIISSARPELSLGRYFPLPNNSSVYMSIYRFHHPRILQSPYLPVDLSPHYPSISFPEICLITPHLLHRLCGLCHSIQSSAGLKAAVNMQGATLFGFLQQKGSQLKLVLADHPGNDFACAVYFIRRSKSTILPENVEVNARGLLAPESKCIKPQNLTVTQNFTDIWANTTNLM